LDRCSPRRFFQVWPSSFDSQQAIAAKSVKAKKENQNKKKRKRKRNNQNQSEQQH
jgi:hypothetical protein